MSALVVLVLLAGFVQDDDSLRREFDRVTDIEEFQTPPDLEKLLFSGEEADFIRGAKRILDLRYTAEHGDVKRGLSLIAFRRAKAKGWKEGNDAAEALIVAYRPRARERSPAFLRTVKELLKDRKDPQSLRTLRLVGVLEFEEDEEFLRELSKHPNSMYRSVALSRWANDGGTHALERVAAFLKDEDEQVRRSALHHLIQRKAVQHSSEIVALIDDRNCRGAVIGAIGTLKIQTHVKKLVEILDSDDTARESERFSVYFSLRSMDPLPVANDVTRLLSHKNPKVRLMGVRLLGHWRLRERESVISVSLEDEDPLVREAAVEALADLPAEGSGGAVANRLDDPKEDVRNRAAVALGRLNHVRSEDRIVKAFNEGKILPAAAAEGLLRLSPRAKPEAILKILDAMAQEPQQFRVGDCEPDFDRRQCIGYGELLTLACQTGQDSCIVGLVKQRKNHPPHSRPPVSQAIAWYGGLELAKALEKESLLDDPDLLGAVLSVRWRNLTPAEFPAYISLVRRLDAKQRRHFGHAIAPLLDEYVKFADDPDPIVRRLVLKALAHDARLRNLPRLLKYAEDPDPTVRTEFLQSVASVASSETHEPVGRLLKDADPNVVRSAIQTVQSAKLVQFVPDVAALMKDEKHRVTAMFALARLGAKEHSAALVPMLSEPESASYAAELLGQMGAPERVPDLLRAVEKGDERTRALAIRAAAILGGPIPKLSEYFEDKDAWVRSSAAFAAGTLKDRAHVGRLVEKLKDPSYAVQAAAIRALADLDARDSVPAILKVLDPEGPPPDEATQATFTEGNNPAVALQSAAEALERMGTPGTHKELVRLWRRSREGGGGLSALEPTLLRLDARKFLEPILQRYGPEYGRGLLHLMNEVGAPRLYESIRSRDLAKPWNREFATLDRLSAKLSEALGITVSISASVTDEVRNRSGYIHAFDKDRNAGILNFLNIWTNCLAVYDEATGSITFTTLADAKRHWLEWAASTK